jgi:hypothetical protein
MTKFHAGVAHIVFAVSYGNSHGFQFVKINSGAKCFFKCADDYVQFLKMITPQNMHDHIKQLQRCKPPSTFLKCLLTRECTFRPAVTVGDAINPYHLSTEICHTRDSIDKWAGITLGPFSLTKRGVLPPRSRPLTVPLSAVNVGEDCPVFDGLFDFCQVHTPTMPPTPAPHSRASIHQPIFRATSALPAIRAVRPPPPADPRP